MGKDTFTINDTTFLWNNSSGLTISAGTTSAGPTSTGAGVYTIGPSNTWFIASPEPPVPVAAPGPIQKKLTIKEFQWTD
jgi:hypothetical protein